MLRRLFRVIQLWCLYSICCTMSCRVHTSHISHHGFYQSSIPLVIEPIHLICIPSHDLCRHNNCIDTKKCLYFDALLFFYAHLYRAIQL